MAPRVLSSFLSVHGGWWGRGNPAALGVIAEPGAAELALSGSTVF